MSMFHPQVKVNAIAEKVHCTHGKLLVARKTQF